MDEPLIAPAVDAGIFDVRGVQLGGGKVSATVTLRSGDAVFTILVSDTVAIALTSYVGKQVRMVLAEPVP